jgi:hypothetical protein
MAQCVECGTHGVIEGPTREEWGEAFHAPSRPYRWHEDARVTVKGPGNGLFSVSRRSGYWYREACHFACCRHVLVATGAGVACHPFNG